MRYFTLALAGILCMALSGFVISGFLTIGYVGLFIWLSWGASVGLLMPSLTYVIWRKRELANEAKPPPKYVEIVDANHEKADLPGWLSKERLLNEANREAERKWRQKRATNSSLRRSIKWLAFNSLAVLFVCAFMVSFISSDELVYDGQTQTLVPLQNKVFWGDIPDSLVTVRKEWLSGRFTDQRPYFHDAVGNIWGKRMMSADNHFELRYTVPEHVVLEHLRQGRLPNYRKLMRYAFQDSVDLMYYNGLGLYRTTTELRTNLRREFANQCGKHLQLARCGVLVAIEVPYFPRRGPINPGPGDNST